MSKSARQQLRLLLDEAIGPQELCNRGQWEQFRLAVDALEAEAEDRMALRLASRLHRDGARTLQNGAESAGHALMFQAKYFRAEVKARRERRKHAH